MGLTADLLVSTRLMNALLLILGNLVFFLTDLVMQRMTLVWTVTLRKRFFK